MRNLLFLLLAGLFGLFLTLPASLTAQSSQPEKPPVDPNFYAGMKWRNIGPYRGGRSLGAAGSPGRPN
ncbi:MAG: hypothetical protein ACI94D_002575, partial [Neolewinella sp.]